MRTRNTKRRMSNKRPKYKELYLKERSENTFNKDQRESLINTDLVNAWLKTWLVNYCKSHNITGDTISIKHTFFLKLNPRRKKEVVDDYYFYPCKEYSSHLVLEKNEIGALGNVRCIEDDSVDEYEFYIEEKLNE